MFWLFCVGAALIGLLAPQLVSPLVPIIRYLLGAILFFTGLKLDFQGAVRECVRWPTVGTLVFARLVAAPGVLYGLARLVLPEPLAVGVLIVAAMPAGRACNALTDVMGGNAALALASTLATTAVCPAVTPWVIELFSGHTPEAEMTFLVQQAAFLFLILLVPLSVAFLLQHLFPEPVRRRRKEWATLAMMSLFLLIAGALASASDDFRMQLTTEPRQTIELLVFMVFFSFFLHVAGYWLIPRHSLRNRVALSVNLAYVNNGLAIVFAAEFFRCRPELGVAALLPAILLEVPMALALVPLRRFVARAIRPSTAA